VVDRNARVADRGKILDPSGRVVRDYSDTGVPARLEFEVPAGTPYFTLEVNGHRIHQGLSDSATVPASATAAVPAAEEILEATPAEATAEDLTGGEDADKYPPGLLDFDFTFEKDINPDLKRDP
jgi:hypothetical protein